MTFWEYYSLRVFLVCSFGIHSRYALLVYFLGIPYWYAPTVSV